MKELVIITIGILYSGILLREFFMDYKKERLFIASVELTAFIMLVSCCVCVICHCTLQALA